MASQAGGFTRFDGAGSLWKSSWKGRPLFSDFCCFQGFDRAVVYYNEPGGALDMNPADGTWVNVIVTIDEPIADGVEALIIRNGTPPEGWEIVATGSVDAEGTPVVTFAFRVYDGAALAAEATAAYLYTVDTLAVEAAGFRLTAFFYPTTVGFPNGQIALGLEGGVGGAIALTNPYSNTSPDLILGAGVGAQEDWTTGRTICGVAGGDGDYSASGVALQAHQEWAIAVQDEAQMLPLESTVGGVAVPNYSADNGWRGNNPYLPPGTAPDPLEPFIGATNLVEVGAGDLEVVCGTVDFVNPFGI